MEKTKPSNNWIPWELWLEILSFLPAQSLLVFRSVCKSFLSIIDNPEFVSLHLHRLPNNTLQTRHLTFKIISDKINYYKYSDDEVVFEVHEINNFFKARKKIIDRVMNPGMYMVPNHSYLKCSIDGLLLLRLGYDTILWNPSIKKHRPLSLPSNKYLQFGLGHGPSSNDYKIIAFDAQRNQAWVYRVKTDTWNEILDTRYRHNLGEQDDDDDMYHYSGSLFFKGKAFWIEHDYSYTTKGINPNKLLWFDFETERFCYGKTPYSGYSAYERIDQELVMLDGGSSLGVWRVDEEDRVFVYSLEPDTMSWTLRYKLAPPHGLRRSMLGYYRMVDSRLEERNGELVWKYWELGGRELHVVSYEFDIKAQVYRRKLARDVQNCLDIYFESLVMLK